MFHFQIIHRSKKSHARVGQIHTPHGIIKTPGYVPVATNGAIKAVDSTVLERIDLDLVFANTYHLALHPGGDVIEKAGGLHRFMSRSKPLITDSGGFQVFSLAYGSVASELKSKGCKKSGNGVVKITEEGVKFRSYRDGSAFMLTPEKSIAIQKQLGADIIIPFDELPPYHMNEKKLVKSLERTHRWQQRSYQVHKKNPKNQAMYAVIHGGVDEQLRKHSCHVLGDMGFDGYALGGSLGKDLHDLEKVIGYCSNALEYEKPKHLLGIADTEGIMLGVKMGLDTYDSCYPTRLARHGVLLNKRGEKIKIISSYYKEDFTPLDEDCQCHTCRSFTKAYVHHLFKAKEPSALTLATIHNLQAMADYMANIREKILNDEL